MGSSPCPKCPFRSDGIRHLGARAGDIVEAVTSGKRIACHMTLELGIDGIGTEEGAACIGALRSGMDLEGVLSIAEFVEVHRAT